MAVLTYRNRDTARFVEGSRVRAFEQCARAAVRALAKLEAADQLCDLRYPPSNHFEALAGEAGRYSIRIDAKWRLCFGWEARDDAPVGTDLLTVPGNAVEVEISNHYD
jgi:proteic killer suppression protein